MDIREKTRAGLPGGATLLLLLAATGFALYGLATAGRGPTGNPTQAAGSVALLTLALIGLGGLITVAPNEGRVMQLFGHYVGTVRTTGLRWVNPFNAKRRISLRVRSFETERLKVNDIDGNPIEIAAVVVWRVVDSAEAMFHVDDYERFVRVQSEAALRNLATRYPYDAHEEAKVSLRGHTATIADHLKVEIQE